MAKDEKVEHKHEDGTKHSHVDGDKEHTHTKSSDCDCARMNGSRNPFCKVHGEKQYRNWQNLTKFISESIDTFIWDL